MALLARVAKVCQSSGRIQSAEVECDIGPVFKGLDPKSRPSSVRVLLPTAKRTLQGTDWLASTACLDAGALAAFCVMLPLMTLLTDSSSRTLRPLRTGSRL